MTTKAQKKAQAKYDRSRNGPVSVRLNQSQRQWLKDHLLTGEGESTAIKRLAGIPTGE